MQRSASRLILGLSIIFALTLGVLQLNKWNAFGYNGLDLAIYTNTVHHLAHGQGFDNSIHDPSYLGDHLELGLVPIAAIYRLAPSGLTLLWIQTLVIAGTTWLVWLVLRSILGWKGGLVGSVVWLLHPFVWNVALYEFHAIALAWPLIWWSIYAYRSRQRNRWWIALGLLCLVREDMPLLVLGWAGLAALDRRGWRWWAPAAIAGLAWFFTAQHLIAGANPQGAYKYLVFYRWAGTTPIEILTFPFRHPIVFLSHVFQGNNWLMTLGLLFASGGLALGRLKRLVPIILPFGQLLLLGAQPESVLRLHYVVTFLPFLLWAGAETWLAIQQRQLLKNIAPYIALPLATLFAVVGPLYAHLLFGPIELPWKSSNMDKASPIAIVKAAVAEVKPADRVLTTFNTLPKLASRPSVYSLNYLYLGRRQYSEERYTIPTDVDVAIIDWQQFYDYQFFYRSTLFEKRTGAERVRDFFLDQELELVWWKDSVAVYRRSGTDDFIPTFRSSIGRVTGKKYGPVTLIAQQTNPVIAQTIDKRKFTTIPVQLQWLRQAEHETPLSIRFTATQNNRTVWSSTRLLGQGTYPSIDWPVGSAWTTRYFLSLPSALHGPITLQAEVLDLTGRYRLNRLRGFTPKITKEKNFGLIDLGEITLTTDNR